MKETSQGKIAQDLLMFTLNISPLKCRQLAPQNVKSLSWNVHKQFSDMVMENTIKYIQLSNCYHSQDLENFHYTISSPVPPLFCHYELT